MKKTVFLLVALIAALPLLSQTGKITVAADGSGDFRTVQEALNAVPKNNHSRVTIFIKKGIYREKLHLDADRNLVSLMGEDKFATILTWDDHTGKVTAKGDTINTRTSASFIIKADDFRAENISFRNDAGFSAGQAVGLEVQGDRAFFTHCRIIGNQDILFTNGDRSRQYYSYCYIEGTTDFIFGSATAWFEHCHIHSKKNSHVTAASTPKEHPFGYVFNECILTGDSSLHSASLGRPWRPYASVTYIHCYIDRHIRPEGWSNWNTTDYYTTARYAEYENFGPGAATASRVPWSKQLSDAEVKNITPAKVLGDWEMQ